MNFQIRLCNLWYEAQLYAKRRVKLDNFEVGRILNLLTSLKATRRDIWMILGGIHGMDFQTKSRRLVAPLYQVYIRIIFVYKLYRVPGMRVYFNFKYFS